MRRRIAAVLAVAVAFAMPLPVVAAPAAAPTVATASIAPAAIPGVDLKCVTMVSDTLAFAAGASGTIIKTTDGGDNWRVVQSGGTKVFTGISFWDATNGVAVTYDGCSYTTVDAGEHWIQKTADIDGASYQNGFNAVAAVPGTTVNAIALAGTTPGDGLDIPAQIWQSGDGGTFWQQRKKVENHVEYLPELQPVGEGEFLGVDFVNSSFGCAVGDDLYSADATLPVYTTSNGGLSWTARTFTVALRLTGVAFGDASNGIIVSSAGRVFRTTNGGVDWTESLPQPSTGSLNGVDMTSSTAGWAAGATGKLLRTADGGSSWTTTTSPTSQDLAAISLSGTHGIAVGKFGTVVITTDGSTWRSPVPDTTGPTMTSLASSTHPDESAWYRSASATLSWSATDTAGVTGYAYVRDTSPTTRPTQVSLGSATTTSVTVPEGVSYFHVIAQDAYGNWSATPLHRALRVDLTAPSTTDTHVSEYTTGVAEFSLTPTDTLSGVASTQWTDNGGPAQTGTLVVVTGDGAHTVEYASTDSAGNREDTRTASFSISSPPVDTTAPTISSLSATPQNDPAKWYKSTSATFSWTATDTTGPVRFVFALDSVPATTSPVEDTSATYSSLSAGTHTFYLRAVDSAPAENWSPVRSLAVNIDDVVPVASATTSTPSGEDATVTLSASDEHSGVARIDWLADGTPGSVAGASIGIPLTGVGPHTVKYSATDAAGNRSATLTVGVSIPRPPTQYVQVEGANRYSTAVAASVQAFPEGAPAVVIATGANWPDALGGAALAGAVGGPILLSDPKALPASVRDEIVRLGATHAYVLGSEAAVSKAVYDAVGAIAGVSVERVAGANRYATANAIAVKTTDLLDGGYDGVMFVATGLNFPDALAASPLSAANGWPLFLAPPSGLSDATISTMKARGSRVIILGSAAAVSTLVENQLSAEFPGAVERLQGSDRYGTGIAVAEYGVAYAGLTWRSPALATGTNFPDALAGGVLQGLDGSVLLLTNGSVLTPSVGAVLGTHKPDIREVRYLGSEAAVSAAVRSTVAGILQ